VKSTVPEGVPLPGTVFETVAVMLTESPSSITVGAPTDVVVGSVAIVMVNVCVAFSSSESVAVSVTW